MTDCRHWFSSGFAGESHQKVVNVFLTITGDSTTKSDEFCISFKSTVNEGLSRRYLYCTCMVPGPHRKWLNSLYQGKCAQKEPMTRNISLICHSLIYSSCYGLLYLHPCIGTAATLTQQLPQRDLSSYYLQCYCYWLHGVTIQSCTTIYRYRPCNHSYHFPVQRTVGANFQLCWRRLRESNYGPLSERRTLEQLGQRLR